MVKRIDVADAANVASIMSKVRNDPRNIEILMCFAGIVCTKPSLDISPKLFRRTIDVNTTGSSLCAKAAARIMVEQNSGGIILLVASVSGRIVLYPQSQAAYGMSKAALMHMAKPLAAEWAVHGIRVSCISPGYMDTVLNHGLRVDKIKATWLSRNPMGRLGQPLELMRTAIFLCSSDSTYITRADVVVDGGLSTF
ncbi:Fc.00g022380.m01.CDS01 [Cosmosporella sp. VM-42]